MELTCEQIYKDCTPCPFQKCRILSFQLTYGSFAPGGSDAAQPSSFYRTVSNEDNQIRGIILLLQHFNWRWVGLLVMDDDNGDRFLQAFEPLLSTNQICSAFSKRIPKQARFPDRDDDEVDKKRLEQMYRPLADEKVRVYIVYGDTTILVWLISVMLQLDLEFEESVSVGKMFILTAQVDLASIAIARFWNFERFKGIISLRNHPKEPTGFHAYLQNARFSWTHRNGFLKEFWEQAFICSFPSPGVPENADASIPCSLEEKLESLPMTVFEMHMTGHSYGIYNAVYALAHALNAIYSSQSKTTAMQWSRRPQVLDLQPWQVVSPQLKYLDMDKHI